MGAISMMENINGWKEGELQLFLDSKGLLYPSTIVTRRRTNPTGPAPLDPRHGGTPAGARVSVAVPTLESRHDFHNQLWSVFDAQTWPDKELVVIETFFNKPSAFFLEKARTDERIVHVPIKVLRGHDFSIGLKRNLCTH